MSQRIVVIGAGPAGLAAAYELGKLGRNSVVLEQDSIVGGLARTVEHKGFRCDIGGHRFFTKSGYVDALWREILGADFLRRPRLSRIYYDGKFFSYPLRVSNVLGNLGLRRSAAVVASLIAAKLKGRGKDETFEDWVTGRFGRKLFEMFFKTYTEKIWGIPCSELSSDWAAQRIRNLSAGKAILDALGLKPKKSVASLIEEFDYPARGPGQMYEAMADRAAGMGAEVMLNCKATRIEHRRGRVVAVEAHSGRRRDTFPAEACFSSMPLDELVLALSPEAPAEVLAAARGLGYRSIVTVNLMIDQAEIVPDTWIYIHDPRVKACRMQLYKNWSPHMVPDPNRSVIGLEYICTEGDEIWSGTAEDLRAAAMRDLRTVGLAAPERVFGSFSTRYAKAYPVYEKGVYAERLATIREYLANLGNLYPIGRYGQFRYNNMDHSILTAYYSVRAMQGEQVDPWAVNVEKIHLEEQQR